MAGEGDLSSGQPGAGASLPVRGNMRFLFAPGAGAASSSLWMQRTRRKLETLGDVESLDYPYRLEGRKLPDRLPVLVQWHRKALERMQAEDSEPVVLVGKSMGGRVGCHVALEVEPKPAALVCLGYPLVGQNGSVRDQVLRALTTPILFVQGTRDLLCPLQHLAQVRAAMRAPSELYVVQGGDHSLAVDKASSKASGSSQEQVEDAIIRRIRSFCDTHVGAGPPK